MSENAEKTNTRPRKIGIVDSDARDKSRKVVVAFKAKHPKYGKYVRKRSVLHVHDEDNVSNLGDTVEIEECAPVSKTKRWKLIRVVTKAVGS